MNGYNILQGVAIVCIIISALMSVAGWVSLDFIFKLEKYRNKIVGETPLLKCTNVMFTGSTLTAVFAGILMLLRFLE